MTNTNRGANETGQSLFLLPRGPQQALVWADIEPAQLSPALAKNNLPKLEFPIAPEDTRSLANGERCFDSRAVLRGLAWIFAGAAGRAPGEDTAGAPAEAPLEIYRAVALQLHPAPGRYYLGEGIHAEEAGRWEEAIRFFRAARRFDPANIELLFQTAMSFRERFIHTASHQHIQRRLFAASTLRLLEHVFRLDTNHMMALYHLGYCYRYFGAFHASAQAWKLFLTKLNLAPLFRTSADANADPDADFHRGYLLGLSCEVAANLRKLERPARKAEALFPGAGFGTSQEEEVLN